MKRIRIDIRTENDAFGDGDDASALMEVSRMLSSLTHSLDVDHVPATLRDSNGHTVGSVKITQ